MIDVPRLLAALGIVAKRRGSDWTALCPHPQHRDKEPSWSMVEAPGADLHGSHHCFGCGWGGGPAELVEARVGCTRGGALLWIEERGLDEPEPAALRAEVRVLPVMARAFAMPAGVESAPFDDWPSGPQRYVLRRGVTPVQVARWDVQFAVWGRLEGRVVFPVRGETSDACADRGPLESYTARSFTGDPVRYLTPAERERPVPGALFGAEHWSGRRDRVTVTEGALDALACERAGAECIAALSGSHASREQLMALAGFAVVVVATDPDPAGERIAGELRAALARHCCVLRARLPAGSDAASLPRERLELVLRRAEVMRGAA